MKATIVQEAYGAHYINEIATADETTPYGVISEMCDDKEQIAREYEQYKRGAATLESHDLHVARTRTTNPGNGKNGGIFVNAGYIATSEAFREVWLTPKRGAINKEN